MLALTVALLLQLHSCSMISMQQTQTLPGRYYVLQACKGCSSIGVAPMHSATMVLWFRSRICLS